MGQRGALLAAFVLFGAASCSSSSQGGATDDCSGRTYKLTLTAAADASSSCNSPLTSFATLGPNGSVQWGGGWLPSCDSWASTDGCKSTLVLVCGSGELQQWLDLSISGSMVIGHVAGAGADCEYTVSGMVSSCVVTPTGLKC